MTRSAGPSGLAELIRRRGESAGNWLVIPGRHLADAPVKVSYAEAYQRALDYADALRRLHDGQKGVVVLALESGPELCLLFLGVVLAGCIPVVQSPPVAGRKSLSDLLTVAQRAGAGLVVVAPEHESLPELNVQDHREILITPDGLRTRTERVVQQAPSRRVRAATLLQYSSGTTREPTGIALSWGAVQANLDGAKQVIGGSERDVMVCWLPLSHDMGLVGLFLNSINCGAQLVLMPPWRFVENPSSWLWALSRFGGTITAAPNFAYHVCASSRVSDASLDGLALGSVRVAVSGSETVIPSTAHRFVARFAKYGFAANALCPAYGLAENTLAVSIASPASALRIDRVDRDALERDGVARAAPAASNRVAEIVAVGAPLPTHEVRIVGSTGAAVPERLVGGIQVRGPSVMLGYWADLEQQNALRSPGSWLATGDRGYLADGHLFVVGREKNIVKRAGRMFDGAEVAAIAGTVPGVRTGSTAAFAFHDAARGTEGIAVLVEVRDPSDSASLRAGIVQALRDQLGLLPDQVVLLRAGQVPKTLSGKVQIEECRRRFTSGDFCGQELQ